MTDGDALVGAAAGFDVFDPRLANTFERAVYAANRSRFSALDAVDSDRTPDPLGGRDRSLEAARFILAERAAPADSIPIHLALKNLGGTRHPDAVTVLGWAVFKDVLCRVYDHLDAIDMAAAAAAANPEPAPSWPGKRAFAKRPGPLDPSGGFTRR